MIWMRGNRFSEKIMRKRKQRALFRFQQNG